MKLLYVVGRFPKLSETFVYNEVAGLMERGHELRVLSIRAPEVVELSGNFKPGKVVTTIPRLPLTARPLPSRTELRIPEERLTRRAYAYVAGRWTVRKGLTGFSPDLVHAHFANLPALLAGTVAHLLRRPYTFIAHAADYMLKMSDDLLRRRILHADAAFVVSDAARRDVALRARLRADEIRRLGVVRASMRPSASPRQISSNGAFTTVSVARLVPMKGIDTALRGFAALRRRRPNTRHWVVGDGPQRPALEALASELGLGDAVTFFGSLDNRKTQELISRADAAVLPCRRDEEGNMDGVPVFMMEAGAQGVPVVSTRTSGIPELVQHEKGGLLVDVEDPSSLADALERLAAEAGLRERLGQGLRARVLSEFSMERQLDRLEARWADILDRRR